MGKEIVEFIWAVLSWWSAWSTGGLLVAIIAIAAVLKNKPFRRGVQITFSFLFLLIAFYSAWNEQKQKAIRAVSDLLGEEKITLKEKRRADHLEDELNKLKYPQFRMLVPEIGVGSLSNGDTSLAFLTDLRNEGAPSIVEDWSLRIISNEINTQIPRSTAFEGLTLHRADGKQLTFGSFTNFFAWRVAQKAVERGTPSAGWVIFVLHGISQERIVRSDPGFIVSFNDYLGTNHSFNLSNGPFFNRSDDVFYPGVENWH